MKIKRGLSHCSRNVFTHSHTHTRVHTHNQRCTAHKVKQRSFEKKRPSRTTSSVSHCHSLPATRRRPTHARHTRRSGIARKRHSELERRTVAENVSTKNESVQRLVACVQAYFIHGASAMTPLRLFARRRCECIRLSAGGSERSATVSGWRPGRELRAARAPATSRAEGHTRRVGHKGRANMAAARTRRWAEPRIARDRCRAFCLE